MKLHKFYYFIIISLMVGCKKSAYLDAKPDQSLVVPHTLKDLQAILDYDFFMNGTNTLGVMPAFGEASSDNYYFVETQLNNDDPIHTKLYTWNLDANYDQIFKDWDYPYRAVFYANTALDGLKKLSVSPIDQDEYNNVKGSALFFRSFMFYGLAEVFAPQYDKNTASKDLGIVLRLSSDVNENINRSTVQATYDQIIMDLKEAIHLLPDFPEYKTRPSKWATYAMLARVYQSIENYDSSLFYANACLNLRNDLMDFNNDPDIDSTNFFPFVKLNKEVIFHSVLLNLNYALLSDFYNTIIDSTLFNSYDSNDKRKSLFFSIQQNGPIFVGSYNADGEDFAGIATDEIYFIRAECYARTGNTSSAINDLNTVLSKRWRKGTFIPITASSPNDALGKILLERRKELLMRGLRWADLRRLNKGGANITLTRKVNGLVYTLPPNSLKYTFLIPSTVIGFNPEMQQNPR